MEITTFENHSPCKLNRNKTLFREGMYIFFSFLWARSYANTTPRALSNCMEKPVRIFRQMEQYNSRAPPICMVKTVVPLRNQKERFFPLIIWEVFHVLMS